MGLVGGLFGSFWVHLDPWEKVNLLSENFLKTVQLTISLFLYIKENFFSIHLFKLALFDKNFIFFQEEEAHGVTATALYDYQAAADDEISFDPNDVITNIEMVIIN